jgi:hypothetical protein
MSHRVLGAALLLTAGAVGCGDRFVTGIYGDRVRLTLTSSEVRAGDSVAVMVEVYDDAGRLRTLPPNPAEAADPAVARVRGRWVVGQRAGSTWIRTRIETGADSAAITVR